jgi:hypothetical protein
MLLATRGIKVVQRSQMAIEAVSFNACRFFGDKGPKDTKKPKTAEKKGGVKPSDAPKDAKAAPVSKAAAPAAKAAPKK